MTINKAIEKLEAAAEFTKQNYMSEDGIILVAEAFDILKSIEKVTGEEILKSENNYLDDHPISRRRESEMIEFTADEINKRIWGE